MAVYTIGDLHLSLGSQKPMDIFSGWGNHVARLEENWRGLVRDGDTVVIAGDISWAMTLDEAVADFSFIESLPGQKLILKGNHDYWWTTLKKMREWVAANGWMTIEFLFNNAFCAQGIGLCGTRGWMLETDEEEDIKILSREIGRLRLSLTALSAFSCDKRVAFLHYPPLNHASQNQKPDEMIVNILLEAGVSECYYGHLHGTAVKRAFEGMYKGVAFRLISADRLKFSPYKIH